MVGKIHLLFLFIGLEEGLQIQDPYSVNCVLCTQSYFFIYSLLNSLEQSLLSLPPQNTLTIFLEMYTSLSTFHSSQFLYRLGNTNYITFFLTLRKMVLFMH